jgi:hypothetical protein
VNKSNKNSHSVNSIFDKLKQAYSLKSDADLAYKLNINQSTLSMQKKRGSIDVQAIINNCSDLDFNWLFKSDQALSEPKTSNEVYIPNSDMVLEQLSIIKNQNEELLRVLKKMKANGK